MEKPLEIDYTPRNLKLWERPEDYFGECWPGTYSAGVGRSRDSDCLEESNFHAMLALIGGESETVTIVRESHWAVGWVEWIAIHQDDGAALRAADDANDRLASYPVLNESDFCERETEAANGVWRDCFDAGDRIRYVREHRSQFEFHDFADLIGCIRGKYFAGYASDLLD